MSIKKTKTISIALGLFAAMAMLLFCSCASYDFSLPDGFDPNATKSRIYVDIEPLQVAGLDDFIDPSPENQFGPSLENQFGRIVLDKFVRCKRFIVNEKMEGRKKYDIKVQPYINFNTWPGYDSLGVKCATVLSARFLDVREEIYEDAIDLQGVFPSKKDGDGREVQRFNLVYGRPHARSGDITAMVTKSFTRAYRVLTEEIERMYPISAKASFKTFGGDTEFHIDIGTDWGLDKDHDVLIYALDADKNITVVALTTPIVGREGTQLELVAWNTKKAEVEKNIIPRIRQNDKTLNLYAVARRKK